MEAEAGRSLGVQRQPVLHSEFHDSQGHGERSSLKTQGKNKNKNKSGGLGDDSLKALVPNLDLRSITGSPKELISTAIPQHMAHVST